MLRIAEAQAKVKLLRSCGGLCFRWLMDNGRATTGGGGGGLGTNQRVDGLDSAWGNRAPGPHRNTARQAMDGLWTEVCGQQKQSNDPRNNRHNPQYANYWAPLTRKQHTMPHSAQPQHANYWAPRTRKRHQQEHRPQRPTESSDPTQHAKGRTGDRPGPRKGATTRRNVTQGGVTEKWRQGVSRKNCFLAAGGRVHQVGRINNDTNRGVARLEPASVTCHYHPRSYQNPRFPLHNRLIA